MFGMVGYFVLIIRPPISLRVGVAERLGHQGFQVFGIVVTAVVSQSAAPAPR